MLGNPSAARDFLQKMPVAALTPILKYFTCFESHLNELNCEDVNAN